MTLANHLLTGAAIAKILPLPFAIPLALVSHFILDALPHFGFKSYEERQKRQKLWLYVIALDLITAILLTAWLISSNHTKWLLVGMVAYSPDLIWIYRFIVKEKFGKVAPHKGNLFIQFHSGIQKYERTWGGAIELAYAAVMFLFVR